MTKVIVFIFIILSFPSIAFAKKSLSDAASGLQTVSGKAGIEEAEVTNVVGNVIAFGLQMVGLFFFILVVYSGFRWMLSQGEEDKITKARDTIVGAIIGLVITVSAYAITSFISSRVIMGESDSGGLAPNMLGSGENAEQLGCCISWTKAGVMSVSKSSWKMLTPSSCKMMNEDIKFDKLNENKFAVGDCPGPKNGCWLFYPEKDITQCEAAWDDI